MKTPSNWSSLKFLQKNPRPLQIIEVNLQMYPYIYTLLMYSTYEFGTCELTYIGHRTNFFY